MAKVLPVGQDSDPARPRQDQNPASPGGLTTAPEPPPRIEPPGGKEGQSIAGLVLGTPAYMPPEQAEGRHDLHDQRSDVYALGAILYEILTGVIPFEAPSTAALLEKVCREPPPRPRARKPGVPRPLEAVVLKALAKRREDRYSSPLALADDVQHWLADEPVSCYAEPLPMRAGRWARRHKPLVATAAAVLLTATLGLALGLYFVNAEKNRTERARQGEERQRLAAEQSEDKAKTEAATATAVKEFLQQDLLQLAAARKQHGQEATGVKMDPDLKVRDLVLRAARKIEGKFAAQPLVEAEIRSTLGWTLEEIGRADLAIPQFFRVRELYTA